MDLFEKRCPDCRGSSLKRHTHYTIGSGEQRWIYFCETCESYFSETKQTLLENLRTPLSLIIQVMEALTEGMGINAVTRVFKVSKNSLYLWQERVADLKETLLLYALCHQFLQQVIEGDEVYTKVGKNQPPEQSEGWTLVLMERASRFLWELGCGRKERKLFKRAMRTLQKVIGKTQDLSLLTDGERRYGHLLFEICAQVLREGQRGRPPRTLPKGVKVRIKNKGDQTHKRGRKRPTYQAPWREHPQTPLLKHLAQIHANHVEAFNASLRRRCAAYRRRTNTYAKKGTRLQQRLDVYWIVHNFVRVHFTTRQVPAVSLGIVGQGLSFVQLSQIQKIA